jgi:ATP synthase protein I
MPRPSDPRSSGWGGVEHGWTLLSELISAIAVWGGIGFGLDRLLGTWPVLFAIGMVVGYAAGAYLVYRQSFAPERSLASVTASKAHEDEPKP